MSNKPVPQWLLEAMKFLLITIFAIFTTYITMVKTSVSTTDLDASTVRIKDLIEANTNGIAENRINIRALTREIDRLVGYTDGKEGR